LIASYPDLLARRVAATGSSLCVGLDPRPDRHRGPAEVEAFCERVVAETAPFAAAFKPNIAYFEAMGAEGYAMLERLLARMKGEGVPVVLDAKRGDIGTTQEHYAKAYFERWDVDAVTLSPYMGFDSIEPFLQVPGKGVYLLAVTSNPGAADLELRPLADGRRVFELVGDLALRAAETPAGAGAAGLVLGLTNVSPEVLAGLPDVPLLVPGLGAQGGDLETLKGAARSAPALVNVSRGILYAEGEGTHEELARRYADEIAAISR